MAKDKGLGFFQIVIIVGLLLAGAAVMRDNLGYPNPPEPSRSVTPAVTKSMR